ncbi:MAG TPA: SelB C-terminal domain-containing protein, partial [Caldilineaceae bacterium]|nr:SelB C-terminal domain-containing protein [Caldilineaceae bacterium]
HRLYPLRRGIPRGELRSRLQGLAPGGLPVRLFNGLVEQAQAAGDVEADDNAVWRKGFTVQLSPDEEQRVRRALDTLAAARFSPPAADEVQRLLGSDTALLEMLVEQGRLVRVGNGLLYRAEEFAAMVEQVRAYVAAHGAITLAEARDLFDTSRKYAQAVLEELDARRITRREGDARVMRNN